MPYQGIFYRFTTLTFCEKVLILLSVSICQLMGIYKYLELVSKSHTQFCHADSYCNSATYQEIWRQKISCVGVAAGDKEDE